MSEEKIRTRVEKSRYLVISAMRKEQQENRKPAYEMMKEVNALIDQIKEDDLLTLDTKAPLFKIKRGVQEFYKSC